MRNAHSIHRAAALLFAAVAMLLTAPVTADVTQATDDSMVEVEHAHLVESSRPEFPETRYNPLLLSYPGMSDLQLPGPDWEPEGQLWVLLLRATLDEAGQVVDVVVDDTNVEDGRMVRRYEQVAMDAVHQWQFEPARIDGAPVMSEVQLPFYFDTQWNVRPIDYDAHTALRPRSRSFVYKYVDR